MGSQRKAREAAGNAPRGNGGGPAASREGIEADVVRSFRVVYQAIQRHSHWVEQSCGVTAAQLWAMWELMQAPGLKVSDLSAALMVHPSTASNLLDKLEDKGLVERRREGPDQRVVHVYPTAQAQSLLDEAPRPAQGALMDALQHLSDAQLAALKRSLNQLVKQLNLEGNGSGLSPVVDR